MNKTPLVSIIIPIHNSEEFLEECIESIQKQSYKNLEIICVNDNSVDKSIEILKERAKTDNRINILNLDSELHGPSCARNCGLDFAKGDFISFCDSDDYMQESMIEKMLNRITEDNSDVVYCTYKRIYNTKEKNSKFSVVFSNLLQISGEDIKRNLFEFPVEPWNKLIRHSKIKSVRFNEKIFVGEDVPFNVELLLNSTKVSFLNYPLYCYRIRDNSLSQSKSFISLSFIEKHKNLINLLNQNDIDYKHGTYFQYLINDSYFNLNETSVKRRKKALRALKALLVKYDITLHKHNIFLTYLIFIFYHLFPFKRNLIRFNLKRLYQKLRKENILRYKITN